MCLAAAGEIVAIDEREDPFRKGRVLMGRIQCEVNLMFVPEAKQGDWVMVHAGFAIATVTSHSSDGSSPCGYSKNDAL